MSTTQPTRSAPSNIGTAITDIFLQRWQRGHRQAALDRLFADLRKAKTELGDTEWKALTEQVHASVGPYTGQDPLSSRCVDKPRGYAGDAVTLDLIYGHPRTNAYVHGASTEGQSVFSCTTNRPASVAVRTRRQTLADAVDACAERVAKPRVLSLACGHLREAELSRAVRANRIGDFYAVDQDTESLAEVKHSYGCYGVTPVEYGVRDILKGGRPAQDLDLAYTAGLYDYLPEDVAVRTTSALFDMVRPGGRVLIANFSPDLLDIGYMEACMDWWLIYRDEADMKSLFRGIPEEAIESVTIWKHDLGSVVYAEAIKA